VITVPVISAACQGCGACLLTCPSRAIRPVHASASPLIVVADRCTSCGECVEICPADAIDMPLRTDALAEVTR
jgi:Pyruvate/2-oxoacid:ferredoxin oxidoreductase delta subunit